MSSFFLDIFDTGIHFFLDIVGKALGILNETCGFCSKNLQRCLLTLHNLSPCRGQKLTVWSLSIKGLVLKYSVILLGDFLVWQSKKHLCSQVGRPQLHRMSHA